jgi:motility quorum-sensing regulator/GCU-specific mRNA interferase toxin
MVTSFTEVRDYPRYELRQVHDLARLQRVYMTRSAVRDSINLGYRLDDVCRCLEALKTSDFRHSGRYDRALWYDVYRCQFTSPSEHLDDLYIKLSLGQDCLIVNLFSFHQTRAI